MMFAFDGSALLENLNLEQMAAVTLPPKSALVLAGAGSGKTRVLTTRIAWLLQSNQATVHSVLAVTFTNKAAKEMQARLGAMLPYDVRGMWLGTFHGLCHRFLRLHYREARLPQAFQILDSADQLSLIKRLLKQMNISDERLAPRALQGFINTQKEKGLRASNLYADDSFMSLMVECFAQYEAYCLREGVVDFAELMLRSYELLRDNEVLRVHYQNRFNHILVDEFQDTNKLQYAWLKLLAGKHSAVFAVGDDDQSIYRFRGADVGNMRALMEEFRIRKPIKLEQNYRSAGNIIAAANAVIANNKARLGKNLRTEAADGEPIRLLRADNDLAEAQFVVEEAKALQRDGMSLGEMAVLYRSNAQSRVLEQAFFQAGLPYKIYGGLRFYERQEVKHALAYLRLALNPEDDNALLRVINFPPRGIGVRTVENIQSAAAEQGVSLWQAACSMGGRASKVAVFVRLIEALREQVAVLDLAHLLQEIFDVSGLYQHYQSQKQQAEQERTENLDELLNAAMAFNPHESPFEILPENQVQTENEFAALAFLSNAALESGENQALEGEQAVQLMTVHAAKGLEFDAVFMTGLEEGRFPSEQSLDETGGLEEERRLMYVAITRAKKRLYLSMAQQRMLHGQMQYGVLSRFVDEIPEKLMKFLSGQSSFYRTDFSTTEKNVKASSKSQSASNKSYAGFQLGENVRHPKFGVGVIINAVDKGESANLTVNFGKAGIKELNSAFAKLEKLS